MIEKLTPEQGALLKIYKDKWFANTICTEPADRKTAEEGIREIYKEVKLPSPRIVWCDSPLTLKIIHLILFKKQYLEALKDKCPDIDKSIWASVENIVKDFKDIIIKCRVRDLIHDSFSSVRKTVENLIEPSIRKLIFDATYGHHDGIFLEGFIDIKCSNLIRDVHVFNNSGCFLLGGQHNASCFGPYNYLSEVLGLKKITDRLHGLWMIAESAGWLIPYENICFVSERHNIYKLNCEGDIHSDSGPAIAYPDGFEIYVLNGTYVRKEIVMTPAEALNPHTLLKAENPSEMWEIVKKIGIERICEKFNTKCIGKKGDYELFDLDLGDNRYMPYLKIKNQVSGVYHIEGMPPGVTTVADALKWRNGTEETPIDVA